jgi:hypothetical protein
MLVDGYFNACLNVVAVNGSRKTGRRNVVEGAARQEAIPCH